MQPDEKTRSIAHGPGTTLIAFVRVGDGGVGAGEKQIQFTVQPQLKGSANGSTIAIGESFDRNSITYSDQISSNGYNEALSVEVDDQAIYFKTLMGGGAIQGARTN
ncbi:hypothetical protein LOY38_14685 [Pseudomonas sp. B21-015]|uniref:hypothetical protein n=1 Tax=Pseudomonas sp. B21-015 TaxID=2895473 RepID=UPI00215DD64C|nr:hypothetical protein [Pseudomonas sp. B21-015]UVM47694.1 hypothetical protein LOY38_14685 [Pseudomonas sp. B21-015]